MPPKLQHFRKLSRKQFLARDHDQPVVATFSGRLAECLASRPSFGGSDRAVSLILSIKKSNIHIYYEGDLPVSCPSSGGFLLPYGGAVQYLAVFGVAV